MIKFIKQKGSTLLELIFYTALFAILSAVVINAFLVTTRAFKETNIMAEIMNGGTIMERLSREIRQATDITSIASTDLVLQTKDSAGAVKSEEFKQSGTNLQLIENSILTGNLNSPSISVQSLSFTSISTTQGKGVRITLTIKSNNDSALRTFDYYDMAIIRGNY